MKAFAELYVTEQNSVRIEHITDHPRIREGHFDDSIWFVNDKNQGIDIQNFLGDKNATFKRP